MKKYNSNTVHAFLSGVYKLRFDFDSTRFDCNSTVLRSFDNLRRNFDTFIFIARQHRERY